MPNPIRCPVCGKPAVRESHPFCSARCAQIDLGRWFTEQYRLPGAPPEEDEEFPEPTLDRGPGVG